VYSFLTKKNPKKSKFRGCSTVVEKNIFTKNQDFPKKSVVSQQIRIFPKNHDFPKKSRFSQKIKIFPKNQDFPKTSRFSHKTRIFLKNQDILGKNQNFQEIIKF